MHMVAYLHKSVRCTQPFHVLQRHKTISVQECGKHLWCMFFFFSLCIHIHVIFLNKPALVEKLMFEKLDFAFCVLEGEKGQFTLLTNVYVDLVCRHDGLMCVHVLLPSHRGVLYGSWTMAKMSSWILKSISVSLPVNWNNTALLIMKTRGFLSSRDSQGFSSHYRLM